MNAPATLEQVGAHPVFPTDVLAGCESALMLFCAGFYGRSDCAHIARAGLDQVIAVDADSERMDVMRSIYPPSWRFETADVFDLVLQTKAFDVVVVDCPVADCERVQDLIPRWTAAARRAVVLTVMPETVERRQIEVGDTTEDGWVVRELLPRSDEGALWMVLEQW